MIDIDVWGVDYQVPSSAADTNWAAKQVAFEQAVATALNELIETPVWTPLTLVNGWVANGAVAPAYYVDRFGFVHFRGAMSGGASGTVCATLPVAARPSGAGGTLVLGPLASGGICSVAVSITGDITVTNIGASNVNAYVTLTGQSFSTAP
jgi:hypothetical protein